MRPPLSLVVLLCAAPAFAGEAKLPANVAEPASVAVEEPSGYWNASNSVSWWGDVKSRRSITLVDNLPSLREICMVPPAADWVTEGATPQIEEQYLLLLFRLNMSINDARGSRLPQGIGRIGRCGVHSPGRYAALAEYANYWNGVGNAEAQKRFNFSGCRSDWNPVKGHPKYASQGKNKPLLSVTVIETVNMLLKSKNPGTARMALGVVQELTNGDKFVDTLESMVKDKTLTTPITISPDSGKETMPLREYAMRALAVTNPTERSAKLLALIWHDDKEDEATRAAAMRAFEFVVEDGHLQKELFPFVNPLMGINMDENDKKDEAGSKAKLSALGEAAWCAATEWPQEKREFARKGLDWDGNSVPVKKAPAKKK